jgi:hypothetical protein
MILFFNQTIFIFLEGVAMQNFGILYNYIKSIEIAVAIL